MGRLNAYEAPSALAGGESGTPQYDVTTARSSLIPEVDQVSGALLYSVPIDVIPGRNGLTPEVSLTYNSQEYQTNGPLGYGWSTSIPYIERVNKRGTENLYTDTSFISSLDGELVLESGSTYVPRTQETTFRKYQYTNGVWTVTEKDGTRYTFGSTTASRLDDPGNSAHVFRWMISDIRDLNNNFVRYTYTKDSGQIYPDSIFYTGTGTTDGPFGVVFVKELRNDTRASYATGFKVETKYRVNEVRAEEGGVWAKKYALAYTTGSNGTSSLLSTVTVSGKDKDGTVTSLPETTFSYQTAATTWTQDTSWNIPEWFVNEGIDQGVRLADYNGDGRTDLVRGFDIDLILVASTSYKNIGTGWATDTAYAVPESFSHGGYDLGARLLDIDGDGLVDIARHEASLTKGYKNTGSNWVATTTELHSGNPFAISHHDQGYRFGDLNGDGLVDLLQSLDNPGYNQKTSATNKGFGIVDDTWKDTSLWATTSVYFVQAYNNTNARLIDINGDGLSDIIADQVYLNTGNGWQSDISWAPPVTIVTSPDNGVRYADVDGDGLPDILQYQEGSSTNKVYLNTGKGWVYNASWSVPVPLAASSSGTFVDSGTYIDDIDGNGLNDFVRSYKSGSTTVKQVWRKDGVKGNILKEISVGSGGKSTIGYTPTPKLIDSGGALKNPILPLVFDVVTTITEADGRGNSMVNQYSYEGGLIYFRTPPDRRFAGFAKTTKTDPMGNQIATYYHQGSGSEAAVDGACEDYIFNIGKPYQISRLDAGNNLYDKAIYQWGCSSINATSSFVKLTREAHHTYNEYSGQRITLTDYRYDDTYGNLVQKSEYGEVVLSFNMYQDTGTDKRTTDLTYIASTTPYIVGLPKQETLKNNASTTIADTKYYYDTLAHGSVGKGNPTKTEQWVSGSTWIDTEKSYNSYGLVTQEKDPRDKATSYTYDSYNLYPATTTNPLGHTTYREYDYSSGKVTKVTDANNNKFETVYDGLDRVTTEKQPDLTTPSTLVTKAAYEYTNTKAETKVKRSDYLDATTTVDTYQYFDGLGRPIQSRSEAETSNTFVTTDKVYNERGELKKESLPYFSTGSASTTATTNNNLLTTYTYDAIGRPKTVANVTGTTTYAYDMWKTTVTDQNGKPKDLTHDAFGRLSSVDEHNASSTYTTLYEYSAANSLTKITDALSNLRNFTYDGLGRRTKAEDLHASGDSTFGIYHYAYDAASNVSSSTNPNSQATNYTYDDLERPLTEDYLGAAGTEVLYAYDTCTYGKGRLCTATSTGATTKYVYNALGGTAQETKTVKGTNYTTAYAYTRRGDQTKVTYPDNSEVVYEYDASGRLETVRRKESSDPGYSTIARYLTYTPIDTIEYAEYGDTSYTFSEYDPNEAYRLRYRASIANDTGTYGSGMPTYLGGDGDAEVPANLARMRALVPQLLSTNTGKKTRYTARTAPESSDTPSTLPTTHIPHDTTATPRTVTKEEQAYYASSRKAHPVERYTPTAHRILPGKAFEIDNTTALRDIQPDGSATYLLSSVNPPRASQRMKTENLWLTNTITENKSFESDTSSWEIWASAGSTIGRDCTTAGDGSCSLKAYSSTAGNVWDTAMLQQLRIEPNVTYKLTFKAKAAATSSLTTIVGQNYSPWLDYGMARTVTVTPTWKTYTYTFRSAASSSDERADVYFGLGAQIGTFYIDDVRLIPDDLTVIRNPSFESGTINEWYFGGPGASYTVPCTGAPDGVCALSTTLTQVVPFWQVEFSHDDLTVASGTSYLLSFDAKANAARDIRVELGQAHDPWSILATSITVPLTSTWTHYESLITPTASDTNARIGFYLGQSTTSVSIDNIRFREAVPTKITDMTPEFSGIYDDPDVPDSATYYQIQVDYSYGDFSSPIWDSGKTSMASTSEGTRIADKSYAGTAIYADGTKYKWRIKLWDNSDNQGPYTNGEDYFYTAGDQVQQAIYAYDRVGNITQILDDNSVGTDKNYVYAYDDLNRLTTTSLADEYPQYVNGRLTADAPVSTVESYAYNAIGNITSKSDLGSYTYAGTGYANPHAVTTVNGNTYTYDNAGNVTADGTRTNTWNYRNELNQTVKGGTTYRYTYDHGGQRTAYYDGSATTTYPNKYYDQRGNSVTKHLYLPNGTLMGSVEGTSTNAVLRYVFTDHLGGTKGVTRDGGARSEMLDYMPFGATRIDAQYESVNESKKYTGHEYDGETGLYYMNARYQNPSTGRFVSQDPVFWALPSVLLANPQKQNSYTYADNNPISMVDPTGEFGLIGAAIGGVVGAGFGLLEARATGGSYFWGAMKGGAGGAAAGSTGAFIPALLYGAGAVGTVSVAEDLYTGTDVNYTGVGQDIAANLGGSAVGAPYQLLKTSNKIGRLLLDANGMLTGEMVSLGVSVSRNQGAVTLTTPSTVATPTGGGGSWGSSSNKSSSSASNSSSIKSNTSNSSKSSSGVNWSAVKTAVKLYYGSGGK